MKKPIAIRTLDTELLRQPRYGLMLTVEFDANKRTDMDRVRFHSRNV